MIEKHQYYQYRYDSSVFLLNQVTDDPVVEELNWFPLRQNHRNSH